MTEMNPRELTVAEISAELQTLQRRRAWFLKSRNMISNRLQASVAGTIGYNNDMTEADRKKKFVEASALIKQVVAGEVASDVHVIVTTTMVAIDAFNREKDSLEKAMRALAKQLPIAKWVEEDDQRGFGILFLAIVIGETGDLHNYENPAKVWRRLGCAPYTKNGETLMGATWRGRGKSKGNKLHAADWEEFGYSPRRRSISYLIGEGIVKQNGNGPYRARYNYTKTKAGEDHPEWLQCPKCEGTGRKGKAKCSNCKGSGEVWMRCHRHGMLLATKLLLKNLWLEWVDPPRKEWSDHANVTDDALATV